MEATSTAATERSLAAPVTELRRRVILPSICFAAIAFVFPDGHLPSRRWRRAALASFVSYVGLIIAMAFAPGHFDAPFDHVKRPTPAYPDSIGFLWVPFFLGVLASLFAAAFAVRTRFRRAVGAERQQILWFAYAALLIPLALLVCIFDGVVLGGPGTPTGIAVRSEEHTS